MSDLEAFLGKLREEGATDSDGTFTIALHAAHDKLQKFALQKNELYIVQLVAAAVSGNASFLQFSSGLSQLEAVFDGTAPSRDELENLDDYLLHASNIPEFLSELALAVFSALKLPAQKVVLESFGTEESWRLELSEQRSQLTPVRATPPVRPLLRVVIDKGLRLNTNLSTPHPERQELAACRFANLYALFENEPFCEPVLTVPANVHRWAHFTSTSERLVEVASSTNAGIVSAHPRVEGYLAIAPRGLAVQEQLYLVHNGCAVAWKPSNAPPNLIGVVHVRGLQRDLSRSGFVQNADFESVTNEILAVAWELLGNLDDGPDLDPKTREDLQRIAKEALAHLALPPHLRPALAVWQATASAPALNEAKEYHQAIEQARQLAGGGDGDAVKKMRLAILNELGSDLKASLCTGDMTSVAALMEPLETLLADLGSRYHRHCLQIQDMVRLLLKDSELSYRGFEQPSGGELHRLGLIFRHLGKHAKAASFHAAAGDGSAGSKAWSYRYQAELELAQGLYGAADAMLKKASDLWPDDRDLTEERAFLKRLVSSHGREKCVRLLQRCLPPPDTDPYVQWLFLDWIVREGRGILPWKTWLEHRARASMLELTSKLKLDWRTEIENGLRANFDLLGWQSLEEARQARTHSVQAAERSFGFVHPYTRFTRRRAVYQLHRLEAHAMADQLQCRGHLLAQLSEFLEAVTTTAAARSAGATP